jgi:HAD superfamily hydrolase (TIGR01459 family)
MTNLARPPFVTGLAELAPSYRFLLCDVWGVVHDGVHAHAPATAALARFRETGGRVLLITNAPRRKAQVVAMLDRLGAERTAYDDLLTSGEAAREYLAARPGVRVFHVGPGRDMSIYEDLPIVLSGETQAELISCTGLFDDEKETPEDYDPALKRWAERGLTMLCANPDKVVERGHKLLWCAGAIAERYRAIGGSTVVVGKPHPPIYAAALAHLSAIAGRPVASAEVLAIGDGMETDIRGAVTATIDVLFVTGGIHVASFGERDAPDLASVHALLAAERLAARALIPRLAW